MERVPDQTAQIRVQAVAPACAREPVDGRRHSGRRDADVSARVLVEKTCLGWSRDCELASAEGDDATDWIVG